MHFDKPAGVDPNYDLIGQPIDECIASYHIHFSLIDPKSKQPFVNTSPTFEPSPAERILRERSRTLLVDCCPPGRRVRAIQAYYRHEPVTAAYLAACPPEGPILPPSMTATVCKSLGHIHLDPSYTHYSFHASDSLCSRDSYDSLCQTVEFEFNVGLAAEAR